MSTLKFALGKGEIVVSILKESTTTLTFSRLKNAVPVGSQVTDEGKDLLLEIECLNKAGVNVLRKQLEHITRNLTLMELGMAS
jgi:hypothetical protein